MLNFTGAQQLIVASAGTNVTIPCYELPVNVTNEFVVKHGLPHNIRWEWKRAGQKTKSETISAFGKPYWVNSCNSSICSVNTSEYNRETKSVDSTFSVVDVQLLHAGIFACSFAPNHSPTKREIELEVLGTFYW